MALTTPIFELGIIPGLPKCEIQCRRFMKDGKWHYFVYNTYFSYASGWADEDWIIKQIAQEKTITHFL